MPVPNKFDNPSGLHREYRVGVDRTGTYSYAFLSGRIANKPIIAH